ncbi:MAG: class I SAM-dependent methyltransferase [Deltaproteobacteria bacterium]|nr:class I SAM-dependent methyltransferase [Deltaproteobacteria bacterium]MCL5278242.1 class I SAM-dependent methyltransferase [Deltaproteobacteria bacterium]
MDSDSTSYNKERDFFDTAYLSFFGEAKSTSERLFNPLYRSSFDRALRFIPRSTVQQRDICETGCNIARYLFYFKELGANNAIGCDISMGILKRALQPHHNYVKNVSVSPGHIDLVQCLAEQLPIHDEAIDTLFCFRSLHHFINKEAFIKQGYRILKDSGLFVIVEPSGSNPFRLLANRIGKHFKYLTEGENACVPENVLDTLEKNNFDIMNISYYNMLSEANVHLGELSKRYSKTLYVIISAILLFTNMLDALLTPLINGSLRKLSWSFVIIARKHAPTRTEGRASLSRPLPFP